MSRTMKASGIEWLGQIPAHWEVKRLKASIKSIKAGIWGTEAGGGKNDIVCIRVADFNRTSNKIDTNNLTLRSIDQSAVAECRLSFGDLLIEKSGGGDKQPVGVVVMFDHSINAVCSNFIARIKVAEQFQSPYLNYVHSALYAVGANQRAIKQTTGIQNLDLHAYLDIRFAFPPLPEQRAIADYLDTETTRIDTLIEKKRRLINLLAERRQAIITQAVTKGLNGTVASESGWKYVPIRRLFRIVNGGTPTSDTRNWDGDVAWATPIDLAQANGKRIDSTMRTLSRRGLVSGSKSVPAGSLILSTRAPIGYVSENVIEMAFNQGCRGLVPSVDLDIRYFRYQLVSLEQELDSLGNGSTFTELSGDNLANVRIFAPTVDEQRAIADHLDTETQRIDTLVSKLDHQINLLTERRQAVITAAVTGKLDISDPSLIKAKPQNL